MSERNQFIFWLLAKYFIVEQEYRLVQLNQIQNEMWIEAAHRQFQLIRLVSEDVDWSNWLKRDIQQAGEQADRVRKNLMKRDLHVLNIYVTEHVPVDDFEHLLEKPYESQSGKTTVQTLLMARETVEASLDRLEQLLGRSIDPLPGSFEQTEADVQVLRQSVLSHARQQEEEERSFFHFGKPFFTYVFLIVQIAMFLLVESRGGSTDIETLIKFGAKYNPLILAGEWWRFFTPIFLHIGLLHLMMNTLALFYLGTTVERMFGRLRFFLIYLFSGFAGSVASFVFTSNLSAGASGAIFGCFGALLYVGVANPRIFFRTIGMNVLFLIGINLVFGFTVPGIDNAGHIGGLIGGLLAAGAVHFPQKRKWGSQLLFFLAAGAAVYFMLNIGYHHERPEVMNAMAQEQLKEENYEEVDQRLSKYVSEGNGDAVTFFQLAYAQIKLHKYDEAKTNLMKTVKLQPEFHEARYNLALLYYEEGNMEKAIHHAKKAVELSDRDEYRDFLSKLE